MGYIGRGLNTGQYSKLDSISFDGSATSYSLTVNSTAVTPSSQNCLLSINGVVQEPFEAFSVTGSIVNFSTAPASDATFFGIIMGEAAFIAGNTVGQNELAASEDIANYIGSAISGSFTTVSSSLASRLTTEEGEAEGSVISSSAQIAADISGSFTAASSSISTRITSNDDDMTLATASIASNESNMTLATASIAAITASISTAKTDISTNSANMTLATASIAAITASVSTLKSNVGQELNTDSAVTFATVDTGQGANELYDMDQNVLTTSSPTFAGVTATGTITAQEFQTQFVSASIIYQSGSTKFGDTTDDIHQFTGSLAVTGSNLTITTGGNVSGSSTSTGSFGRVEATNYSGDGSSLTGIDIPTAAAISGSFEGGGSTKISGSSTSTGSFGRLHVAGGGAEAVNNSADDFIIGSGDSTSRGLTFNTTGNAYINYGDSANRQILFRNSSVQFNASGNWDLVITGSNGNVGIGNAATATPYPDSPLHILSAGTTENTPTWTDLKAGSILLHNNVGAAGDNTDSKVGIFACHAAMAGGLSSGIAFGRVSSGHWGSDIRFYTHPTTESNLYTNTERMRIDSSGNVTGTHGDYHISSDERLKQDIALIPDALAKVQGIRGVTFNWKDEEQREASGLQVGVIAQEVETVLPEAVNTQDMEKDGTDYKAVLDGNQLTALLIEAVKELSAKVEALENE